MTGKREVIEPYKGDKRYVRRDYAGRFTGSDDVGRSLAADGKKNGTTVVRSAKTGRVERALSAASERTGAFKKKY